MEEWKYIEKSNNELEVSNTGKIRNSKSKKELKLYLDKQKNELCVCYNKYHYVVKSEKEIYLKNMEFDVDKLWY